MTFILQDVIRVAEALQYISYYHPTDFVGGERSHEMEESAAAKDAMAQILINSRLCAEGKRPICQDTGIVTVFLKVVCSCSGRVICRLPRWSTKV